MGDPNDMIMPVFMIMKPISVFVHLVYARLMQDASCSRVSKLSTDPRNCVRDHEETVPCSCACYAYDPNVYVKRGFMHMRPDKADP